MNVYETIVKQADTLQPELVKIRRDFHKYAETGWFEMRTSSIIARKLTDLGYEVLVGEQVCKKDARMGVPPVEELEKHYAWAAENGADPEFLPATRYGMTGVIGILRCGEGPTVAMRFDIDALGVIESTDEDHVPYKEGFASVNYGSMHACGHDSHAAIGLGVAEVLMQIKDQLHGTVKLIFQPSEEGVRGAKSIVEKGHLDDADFVLGNHVTGKTAEDPTVVIPGCHGGFATYKYDVIYRGTSAHAAGSPHLGNNALLAAASAVMNLYSIPRHGKGETRINVGTLVAGSGRNVIADEAKMELEVRGATTEINEFVDQYARRILENCAQMHGCTCEIKLMGGADSMQSDQPLMDRVTRVCAEKLGIPMNGRLVSYNGGSEDFSYMMGRVQEHGGQATFFRVACLTPGPAHNRKFDIEEHVLATSVKVFCGVAADILE